MRNVLVSWIVAVSSMASGCALAVAPGTGRDSGADTDSAGGAACLPDPAFPSTCVLRNASDDCQNTARARFPALDVRVYCDRPGRCVHGDLSSARRDPVTSDFYCGEDPPCTDGRICVRSAAAVSRCVCPPR